MKDLIQDISILTTIGKYNLDQLVNKSVAIISHDVEESLRDGNNITSIDIGIGELHILHTDGSIKYKFIPSKRLDDVIVDTCVNRQSALDILIDKALGERIQNTYKDLF